MVLTTRDLKDKSFRHEFRGYNKDEVDDFLDVVTENYENLVRLNREQEQKIRDLEERIAYVEDMKDSLAQSVILAQETAEKVKTSAQAEADNLVEKATYNAQHLVEVAKAKANQILRDATDDAKRVAVETEDLKRQTRLFHHRLLTAIEGQMGLVNSPEWTELLQPTAVYLQNSDAAFKEVVEQVLNEHVPDSTDSQSFDATRQFSPEEMEELQRRIAEANAELEEQELVTSQETRATNEIFSGETQTFKLNI